jgi:hypothetical protein
VLAVDIVDLNDLQLAVYDEILERGQQRPTKSQRERLEAFCKVQEDWRIIAHHEDRATGTKLERPGLQAEHGHDVDASDARRVC